MEFSYRFTIDNQELILERCDLAFLNTIDKLPDGTDPGVLYKLFSISALNLYKIPTENENFHKIEEFFKNVEDDSDTNIGYNLTAQYLYVYCPCCHKENILNNFTRTYDIPPYYPGPIFCNQEAQIHS